MAYTDLTATFIYKGLLTYQQMDALAENDAVMLNKDGSVTAIGAMLFTPSTAVTGLTITQANAANALIVDTAAAAHWGIQATGKLVAQITQDISGGQALEVKRNIAEAGAFALAALTEQNANSTQAVCHIQNAGSGYDIQAPAFTLNAGYVGAGHEALRLDVVPITLDGTSADSVGYTSGLKTRIRGLSTVVYDDGASKVYGESEADNAGFNTCSFYDDTADTLVISYNSATFGAEQAYFLVWYVA